MEKREEGLILINTLPLETYLCYVVPSEMPSSYPIEALKAQAVCARCYAMLQMENSRCEEFGADLDLSLIHIFLILRYCYDAAACTALPDRVE